MLSHKKVIICDLDGTILDSLGVWDSVDTALAEALGGLPGDESVSRRREALLRELRAEKNPYLAYCGALGRLCGSKLSAEEILMLRDRISFRKLACEVPYRRGAPEALRYLKKKGFLLGIATTTRRRNMDIYLGENDGIRAALPLDDWMAFLYTREDVSEIKPAPEVHQRVLSEVGAAPTDCLIIEDSLSGVMAARNAGIDAAVLAEPYSAADWPAITKMAKWHFSGWPEFLAAARTEIGD